jgi:hypothetical protein
VASAQITSILEMPEKKILKKIQRTKKKNCEGK